MITYRFKDTNNNTHYFSHLNGITSSELFENKYYVEKQFGCCEYIGTSLMQQIDITFNYISGPFDDPICTEESEFAHCIEDCNNQGTDLYYENILYDGTLIKNKYYGNPKEGYCYKYKGYVPIPSGVTPQSSIIFNYGAYTSCGCVTKMNVFKFEVSGCVHKTPVYEYYLSYKFTEYPSLNKQLRAGDWFRVHKGANGLSRCYHYLGLVEDDNYEIQNDLFIDDANVEGEYATGYDDCLCGSQEMHDVYVFSLCNGTEIKRCEEVKFNNETYIPIVGSFYKTNVLFKNKCYEFIGIEQGYDEGMIIIDDGPFDDCDCKDKPEPPTTENSECVISTCKGEEKHINLSNNIINLLRQKGYVTFKWNNKCYYIIEVVGEENPELQIMDIEHLNGIYPGCTECNNDGVKHKDNTEYYEKVNCEFANAVYNKAMSDRYGVEFCCEKDLQRLTIKKKLLDAGQLQDDIDLCEL